MLGGKEGRFEFLYFLAMKGENDYMNSPNQTRRVLYPPAEPIERFRECFALALMTLAGGWFLLGLFLLTWRQQPWVLISSALLIYPFYLVVHYYFGRRRR